MRQTYWIFLVIRKMNNYLFIHLPEPYYLQEKPDNIIQTEESAQSHIIVIDLYAEEITERDREV